MGRRNIQGGITRMSDETQAPDVPETHEHLPAKQGSRGNRTFPLKLLILVVLAGFFFYLWQQQHGLQNDVKALESSVDKLLGVVEQRHQQQMEALKSVPSHQHSTLEQRLGELGATLNQQQRSLQQLRSRLGQERRGWVIAEAEYLLRIADHRLQLEQDPLTAIAALRAARSRLEKYDSQSFAAVINQIGVDIDKLAAIELPDRSAMAEEIATLAATIDALPLADQANPIATQQDDTSGNSAESLSDDSWKSIWQKVWRDIRGLVTIRREGEVERPILVPEQRYFLRQNLQMKLESARLSLLAGNASAWRASLKEAAEWMRRYFDVTELSVSTAITTLERLSGVELAPALPTLDESRRLLQQAAATPGAALQQPDTAKPAQAEAQKHDDGPPPPKGDGETPEAAEPPQPPAEKEGTAPEAQNPEGNDQPSQPAQGRML